MQRFVLAAFGSTVHSELMRFLTISALASLFLFTACGDDSSAECSRNIDCSSGVCVAGMCMPSLDAGDDADDAMRDVPVCECVAGQVCDGTTCRDECGNPEAMACGDGKECNYATGMCVDEGSDGVLRGEGEMCGDTRCLPGARCSLGGECVAAAPCGAIRCAQDGSACWGVSCRTERRDAGCQPAPLSDLNRAQFLTRGDGALIDLEFDNICNAYGVTFISGQDFLVQMSPEGTLSEWGGVTNLNMGEVAVRRIPPSEFEPGDTLGRVGLTYICCATCGCVGDDPQGVAQLDRENMTLPMVVVAQPSVGTGPFGSSARDTGPFGLTWGYDNTLYVGNQNTNGDLVRADLDTGAETLVHTFDSRVYATTPVDGGEILVALEDLNIWRLSPSGQTAMWAVTTEPVTSLARDPFLGHIYVSFPSGEVWRYSAAGEREELVFTGPTPGRASLSPDGGLYYLAYPGGTQAAEVLRAELPSSL